MRAAELVLRKELAVTRLRIARTEMALARSKKPDSLLEVSSAVDLVSSILGAHSFGKWSKYAQFALHFVQMILKARRGI